MNDRIFLLTLLLLATLVVAVSVSSASQADTIGQELPTSTPTLTPTDVASPTGVAQNVEVSWSAFACAGQYVVVNGTVRNGTDQSRVVDLMVYSGHQPQMSTARQIVLPAAGSESFSITTKLVATGPSDLLAVGRQFVGLQRMTCGSPSATPTSTQTSTPVPSSTPVIWLIPLAPRRP